MNTVGRKNQSSKLLFLLHVLNIKLKLWILGLLGRFSWRYTNQMPFSPYIPFMLTTSICYTYFCVLFTVAGTMSNALFPPCAQLNLYITQGMPSKFIFSYLRGCFSLRHSFCLACLDATNPNHWKEKTIHIVEEHKTSTVKECPWEGADAMQFWKLKLLQTVCQCLWWWKQILLKWQQLISCNCTNVILQDKTNK